MKMLLTCFLLALVAKGLAEEPKALANARFIYESELAKAQKQMEADHLAMQRDHLTSHIAVLESYKKDAMKSGNLEEAILYDKEIKRVGDSFNEPIKPPKKKTAKDSSGLRESGEISNKAGQSLRLKGNAVYYHKDANHVGSRIVHGLGQPKPIFMDINDNGDWIVAVSKVMHHGQGTTLKSVRLSEKPIIGGVVKINRNGEWLCAAGYTINLGRKSDKRLEIKKFDKRISSAEAKVSDLGNWEVEGKLENGRSFKETGRMPTSW
jgi:hypothetical protein